MNDVTRATANMQPRVHWRAACVARRVCRVVASLVTACLVVVVVGVVLTNNPPILVYLPRP